MFVFLSILLCLSSEILASGSDVDAALPVEAGRSAGPRSFGIEDVAQFIESARLTLLSRADALEMSVECYRRGDVETAEILSGDKFNVTTTCAVNLDHCAYLRQNADLMSKNLKRCLVIEILPESMRAANAARSFGFCLAQRVIDLAVRRAQVHTGEGYFASTHPEVREYQDLLDATSYNDKLLPEQALRDSIMGMLRYFGHS